MRPRRGPASAGRSRRHLPASSLWRVRQTVLRARRGCDRASAWAEAYIAGDLVSRGTSEHLNQGLTIACQARRELLSAATGPKLAEGVRSSPGSSNPCAEPPEAGMLLSLTAAEKPISASKIATSRSEMHHILKA